MHCINALCPLGTVCSDTAIWIVVVHVKCGVGWFQINKDFRAIKSMFRRSKLIVYQTDWSKLQKYCAFYRTEKKYENDCRKNLRLLHTLTGVIQPILPFFCRQHSVQNFRHMYGSTARPETTLLKCVHVIGSRLIRAWRNGYFLVFRLIWIVRCLGISLS